jgi:hypothetical protein
MKKTLIGYKQGDQQEAYYIEAKQRSTHMHIIGSTGTGKSKFIEHLIREDIIQTNGLCLIDPHGYMFNDLVRWCETHRMFGRKKIILFDPSQDGWSFAFNPFKIDTAEISYHVDKMVQAVAQVWGGEDTDKTPLLKRNLRMVFQILAENRLSLLESTFLLDSTDANVRKYLTKNITDPVIKKLWDFANTLKPRPFMDEFGSAVNRMMEFLSSPIIKNTLGMTEKTIDLKKVMDEGAILLVNLAAKDKISDDNAQLLGTLIVNDLFMKCRGRPEGSRPFYLYIDECARYINDDIARILDEGRKFGLHLILAHQHLAQLEEVSPKVYRSVMTDAKAKVVFGGLTAEDARVLAENIFAGEIELQEPKEVLNKPVAIDHTRKIVRSYGEGESVTRGKSFSLGRSRQSSFTEGESEGKSIGSSEGRSQGSGLGSQEAISYEPGGGMFVHSQSIGQSFNSTDGRSRGESRLSSQARSKSWGMSEGETKSETESYQTSTSSNWSVGETFIPVLQERPSSTYSLEEQISRAMWVMMNQPTQYAIIKIAGQKSQMVKTPDVISGFANQERVTRFKIATYQKTDFAHPKEVSEKIIKERMDRIAQEAEDSPDETPPTQPTLVIRKTRKKEPVSFRG